MPDDGRDQSSYLAHHYLCAWCWSPPVEKWDGDKWIAVCPINPMHAGYHREDGVLKVKDKSQIDYLEFRDFYLSTSYAIDLGLRRRTLEEGRQAFGRDDGGLV